MAIDLTNEVATLLNAHIVRITGITTSAAGDQLTIGLAGDAGADVELPPEWVGSVGDGIDSSGVARPVSVGDLGDRTKVIFNWTGDNTGTVGGVPTGSFPEIKKSTAAPWRVTVKFHGTIDNPTSFEIYLDYAHSIVR